MFLKLVSQKLKLPFYVAQVGKAFVFPKGKLPRVCIEEFSEEGARGLIRKFPGGFEQATKEEVALAVKEAGSAPPAIPTEPGKLEKGDVLVGTITVGDFLEISDVEAFLVEAKLPLEKAQELLVYEAQNRNDKQVKKMLREYIKSQEG